MACVSRNVRTTRSESLPAFRSNVPFLNALRSGLLTFFSSLVIQESLINCAEIIRSANDLKFNKSKKNSHCESFSSFCLSALYPVVEFAKAETQAFLALSARLYKSLTAKLEPSSSLNAFAHILIVLQILYFGDGVVFFLEAIDDLLKGVF